MMGTKERAFAPLCNRSVDDLVPADNFYRHLEAKLDLGFVRNLIHSTYKGGGRPSVDPRAFFKLQWRCSSKGCAPSASWSAWPPIG